jgi:predicted ABC-type ATPase
LKEIVVLGGPNGAGKTTAARILLPRELGIYEFVNADEIARGISPFNPEGAAGSAARMMIERMRQLVRSETSFAFETTCAGRGHLSFLKRCRAEGWRMILVFLWLPSPQLALDRVARRVSQGGHAIPEGTVIRRYWAGLANMRKFYLPLADVAAIYDNSDQGPALIAQVTPNADLVIHDPQRWTAIERQSP